jgi:hypothetical protein
MSSDEGGVGMVSSSRVRRGRSRRGVFPRGALGRAAAFFTGALARAAAFFRRAGLRAALRAALRFGAFDRIERRTWAFLGFRDAFAFLPPPLAFRLAISQLLGQP